MIAPSHRHRTSLVICLPALCLLLLACGTPPPLPPSATPAATLAATATPVPGPGATPTAATLGDLPAKAPVSLVWQTNGTPVKFDRIARLAVDGQNHLYVLDRVQHRILKYDSDGHFLMMWGREGSGDSEFTFGTSFGFGGGIAASADGRVYVADGTHRIQQFDSDGRLLGRWGGEGAGEGRFQRVAGLAIDREQAVLVADAGNHRVQKFDRDGAFLLAWGSEGVGNGQFQRPSSIAADPLGNVYVSDGTQRIQKFDSGGRFLMSWGVRGAGEAEFNGSINLAVDAQGIIYVADGSNYRVQIFDRDGNYLARWGQQGNGPGEFGFVGNLALDSQGAIYVVDITNVRIQKFQPRQPWPTTSRGTPTPRPPTPTPTPPPTPTPAYRPFVTPTDR